MIAGRPGPHAPPILPPLCLSCAPAQRPVHTSQCLAGSSRPSTRPCHCQRQARASLRCTAAGARHPSGSHCSDPPAVPRPPPAAPEDAISPRSWPCRRALDSPRHMHRNAPQPRSRGPENGCSGHTAQGGRIFNSGGRGMAGIGSRCWTHPPRKGLNGPDPQIPDRDRPEVTWTHKITNGAVGCGATGGPGRSSCALCLM